jgi:hypothetical protein
MKFLGKVGESGAGLNRYLIADTLPDSAEGSCHQIKVSVDRPNALVFARQEYCHLRDTAADPLKGTILAKQFKCGSAIREPAKY